jgi:hypothetical protein
VTKVTFDGGTARSLRDESWIMSAPLPSSLLSEALPRLAAELQGLLRVQNEFQLAAQVPSLRIVDRCRCGDDFCATFYTQPKPKIPYFPDHRNVDLSPEKGMIILDVVDGKIVCVEVLFRDEVRSALHAILP